MIELLPGDIFLTRNDTLKSKLIRFFSTRIGESRTKVSHVGIIVRAGIVGSNMNPPILVEAVSTVVRREFEFSRTTKVAVYRPINIPEDDLEAIVAKAESYVGKKYGYAKIALHFLDWCLQGAYVFRRLGGVDAYPICSYLVSHAYGSRGYHFGVADNAAEPDDLHDYTTTHPNHYRMVCSYL